MATAELTRLPDNEIAITGKDAEQLLKLLDMLDDLDDHSNFLDAGEYTDLQDETNGRFGGVGIELGLVDDYFTVIAPLDDTPASRAGRGFCACRGRRGAGHCRLHRGGNRLFATGFGDSARIEEQHVLAAQIGGVRAVDRNGGAEHRLANRSRPRNNDRAARNGDGVPADAR